MTALRDLTNRGMQEAVEATMVLLTSLLTDTQQAIAATVLANNSAASILATFKSVSPPQEQRTGIILPYAVSGSLRDWNVNAHEAACIVVGSLGQPFPPGLPGSPPPEKVHQLAAKVINNTVMDAPIGSEAWYRDPVFRGPGCWRSTYQGVSPGQLWAYVNATPDQLGSGFIGNTPIKGNRSRSGRGGGPTVPGDADLLNDLNALIGGG